MLDVFTIAMKISQGKMEEPCLTSIKNQQTNQLSMTLVSLRIKIIVRAINDSIRI